jgi:hypothetical protein
MRNCCKKRKTNIQIRHVTFNYRFYLPLLYERKTNVVVPIGFSLYFTQKQYFTHTVKWCSRHIAFPNVTFRTQIIHQLSTSKRNSNTPLNTTSHPTPPPEKMSQGHYFLTSRSIKMYLRELRIILTTTALHTISLPYINCPFCRPHFTCPPHYIYSLKLYIYRFWEAFHGLTFLPSFVKID